MLRTCVVCEQEYDDRSRRRQPGRIIECNDCAEEAVDRYTGVMIYTHKTAPSIQINADPRITRYMLDATKLKNKGSNLSNNLTAARPSTKPPNFKEKT